MNVAIALIAATGFHGHTSQHRPASVLVGADGQVERIRIGYDAPCRDPRFRFPNTMQLTPPFVSATPDAVTEEVVVRDTLKGGGRTKQTVQLTAQRAGDVWSGTFATRVVLTKHGKWIDTCQLRHVTWRTTA